MNIEWLYILQYLLAVSNWVCVYMNPNGAAAAMLTTLDSNEVKNGQARQLLVYRAYQNLALKADFTLSANCIMPITEPLKEKQNGPHLEREANEDI